MRTNILLILLLVVSYCKGQTYGSQSMIESEIIEHKGIKFLVKVHVSIEETKEGGMGSQLYKVRLTSLASSIHDAYEVVYRGKTYYPYSFNNGLKEVFSNVNLIINKVDVSVELTGSNNCAKTSIISASQGSINSILCSVEKGKKLGIAGIKIYGASFKGFTELFATIDKFENLAATQKAKELENNNQLNKNTTTPTNTSASTSNYPNTNTSLNNPTSSTPRTTNTYTDGNRTIDNFNQPNIKVNPQGYDAAGNYIGKGTYNNTGSGTFIPSGPGKLRADGNYDVVDKNTGKVEIISKSQNLKIQQNEAAKAQAANYQLQQQKMQEQFKQQQLARQQQAAAQAAQSAQISALADQAAYAVANIASGIGSMIADAKARKERERQREIQRQQQIYAEQQRIASEKKFRLDSRTSIFENYKPGNIPTYTTKINTDILYYFIYAYDNAALSEPSLPVYISNVFSIKKASDGTWPYKRNIDEAIEPLSPYKEVFHGYYLSIEEAEMARNGFVELHQQIGATFTDITFRKEKKSAVSTTIVSNNTNNTNKQFWDTSYTSLPKKQESNKVANKTDAMWDISSNVNQLIDKVDSNKTKPSEKSTIDFWSEEPIKKNSANGLSNSIIDQESYKIIFNSLAIKDTDKASELLANFPVETDDLLLESLRAHTLLLQDNTAKALPIYKKHIGKVLVQTNNQKWEDKITSDITDLQKKGIEHQHFPLILTLLR